MYSFRQKRKSFAVLAWCSQKGFPTVQMDIFSQEPFLKLSKLSSFFLDLEQKRAWFVFSKLICTYQEEQFGEKFGKKRYNLHIFFGLWANIFGLRAENFWRGCQNCVLFVQRNSLSKYFFPKKFVVDAARNGKSPEEKSIPILRVICLSKLHYYMKY